ncbi:Iduronate-2-sulfatase [Planctomycetales bacterium 10988]|nr:Iduronate-2-sulfatase [Planctomycetales bacterium 10988]
MQLPAWHPFVFVFLALFALHFHAENIEGGERSALPNDPPNVLFLAVDDLNDWVDCLQGYPGTVHTPNIDRLAKEGVLFTNAHCVSPKCAPSRAAILTGLRPSSTGLYENSHWWLPNLPHVKTLPTYFRENGYHVVGAGKIFHHTAGNNPPNQWDDYFRLTFRNDPWFRGVKKNYPWSEDDPYPPGFPFSGVKGLGHENDWGSLGIKESEYDDSLTASYAIDFLKKPQSNPFFLACGIFRPHLPWYVPQNYFDLYPLEEIELPVVREDDLDDVPAMGQKLAGDRHRDLELIQKSGNWKSAVRAYLASISYADAQLGRVLDTLAESPHASNTIVVLWSDHGWHLGEKQHWHKSTLWEEATRIPLVISAPNYSTGSCPRPVSLIDLFPTLLELCGLQPIAAHDGTSLVPLLKNPKRSWDRPAVIEYLFKNAAVRSERYRYIRYRDGSEELYDHQSDPHEWQNLAENSEYDSIKTELAKWLPKNWDSAAKPKSAFTFDPSSFTWTEKSSGSKISGSK